jgi:hypothetical protein
MRAWALGSGLAEDPSLEAGPIAVDDRDLHALATGG